MFVFGFFCLVPFFMQAEGQLPRNNRFFRPSMQAPSRAAHRPPVDNGQQPQNNQSTPQGWRDLMNNVHSPDDFIHMLVADDGRPVAISDVFSPYETPDGKRVITGGGVLATSDECSPRNMSVRLPLNFTDSQVAYYPECTQVQRCGGCTPTPNLSCEPQYKEKIVLKVLRARYLFPGALSMRWEGFSSVEVERHLTCQVVCNLTPGDCRRGQRFNPYQCTCQCLRSERCASGKVWDADNCRCRCNNEGPCCAEAGGEDDRTCNAYFDPDFCECTLKTSIGLSRNSSQAEIEAWLVSRSQPQDNLPSANNNNIPATATTTVPTTTTTTTTAAPTPRQDCEQLRCPSSFVRVVNNHGNCVCLHRLAAAQRRLPRRRG